MAKGSFVRISSLLWADILVGFAFFVMQNYLTDVWGLSFTHSAAIMNIFGGICLILPLFCQFLVDERLGNFGMLVVSSIAYSLGIGFISLSTPPVLANSTGTCKQFESQCIGHTQKVLFYIGMAMVAVGVSGNKVSVKPFLDEQKDEQDGNPIVYSCWQFPGALMVVLVGIVGAIALPYINPWSIRFGIPAICTVVAMILFLTGSCGPWSYEKKLLQGKSPISNVCRVFVVFASNIFKPLPLDAKLYKHDDDLEAQSFTPTRFLRCLEKAAIDVNPENEVKNILRPCSVAQVEEAKISVRMIPIWMTFIVCGIVSSIGNTYFVEQANHMNRKIGKWNVPPQMLLLLSKGAKRVFDYGAQCLLMKPEESAPSKGTPPECGEFYKGKPPVFGIAFAMLFSVLCCITAARIEMRRLHVVRINDLLDKPDDDIPMSIYWLLFQFFLLAGLDSFMGKSVVAFYACQAPESMRDYLKHFTDGVSGIGFMCSVLSVYVVGQISENVDKKNWFQFTLSRSRLDKYYWVLAVLSLVNLVIFGLVACFYRYKNPEVKECGEGDNAGEGGDEPDDSGDGCFSCCC